MLIVAAVTQRNCVGGQLAQQVGELSVFDHGHEERPLDPHAHLEHCAVNPLPLRKAGGVEQDVERGLVHLVAVILKDLKEKLLLRGVKGVKRPLGNARLVCELVDRRALDAVFAHTPLRALLELTDNGLFFAVAECGTHSCPPKHSMTQKSFLVIVYPSGSGLSIAILSKKCPKRCGNMV
ncbi:hypothetical protein CLOSTMETH_03397 [[Clostridium] methylpentosum DSM 5476]|uniref:Uncharacterized protein n=1 Tax=[Clostridium] methylpentosum DSM 5476 TaxID=537013 RepID=C0EHQ2_9FIRM|nr:hypothetical protein CLOSTMETH_03397 [[Clostridium] methylpentosum DSM 5476]